MHMVTGRQKTTPLPGQDMPEGKLSEEGIRKDLEGPLRRLQTDYIDLYTEHQMDVGTEEQVAEVMGKLIIYGTRDGRDIKKMGTIPDSTTK